MKIRDGKLYRLSHKTFAEYCEDKWSITKTYANNLIKAQSVIQNLTTNVVKKPDSEGQIRPLTRIQEPAEQRAAWLEAVET